MISRLDETPAVARKTSRTQATLPAPPVGRSNRRGGRPVVISSDEEESPAPAETPVTSRRRGEKVRDSTKPITKAKHGTAVVSLDHVSAYLCLGPSSIITQWILPLFQFTAGGFMADSRHMALRPAAFPYEAHHNLQKRTYHRQRLSTLEHIVFFSRTSDHGY